ncbi:reverse transcriptase domain-containing protein [Tanacetum coccineum]|uniref:Reverse transcriptase domain-containing protein n=1 Tax=Tanacetum coccineum TaxID=301880 RepID=A0ABQ5FWX1_9ASTR
MIPKRRNRRRSKQIVEPELRTIVETPVATKADTRTMSELLQAPTEGYGDAIALPAILAENFELKVELLTLYDGPMVPPTSSPLPKEVERVPEATKDKLVECLALADLGASINLMPLSVWKKLSLLELTPTRMTLELVNRSVAYPVGVTEDVFVKVGKSPFLRTARELINVHREELILRDEDEKLIFHADNTSKHPQKHANESINMINFIDITCEDRFSEVLKFKKSNHPSSGYLTPASDSAIESLSPSPLPYEDSDPLLEETDIFLSHFNDSSPN